MPSAMWKRILKNQKIPGIIYCIVPMKYQPNFVISIGINIEIIDLKSLHRKNKFFQGHDSYV